MPAAGDLDVAMTVAVAVTLAIAVANLLCRCGGGHDHGLRGVGVIVSEASVVTLAMIVTEASLLNF